MNVFRDRRAPYAIAAIAVMLMALMMWWKNSHVSGPVRPLPNSARVLEELTAEGQPEGENAWPRLMELLDQFLAVHDRVALDTEAIGERRDDDDSFAPQYDRVAAYEPPDPNTSDNIDPERAVFAELEAAGFWESLAPLAQRRRAIRTQPTGMPIIAQDGETSLRIGRVRTMAMARMATGRLAARESAWNELVQSVKDVTGLARLVSLQSADNFAAAVSGSMLMMQLHDLRFMLMEHEIPEATLLELLEILEDANLEWSVERMLMAERIRLLDLISYIYTDNGAGDGYLLDSADALRQFVNKGIAPPIPTDEAPDVDRGAPTRSETTAAMERMFAWLALKESDPDAANTAEDIWNDELEGIQEDLFDPISGAMVTRLRNLISTVSFRSATSLMIALELHARESGAYPASLDTLVPKYLDAVPNDSIHGGPFGYRLLDDDPYGRGYLLYSFGLDGEDNNGKVLLSEHWEALRSRTWGRGHDFVFNLTADDPALVRE